MRSLLQRWLKPEQPCWVMWIRNRCPVQNRTLSQSIDLGIFIELLTTPFECTWDPNRRHWKKQTWQWKGFSRIVGDILPSHLPSQVNLLAQLWSILQSQGVKCGSVDDQLTSRCHSHNKNSFWLESNIHIYNVQSHQGWSKHSKSHHWSKIVKDGAKNLQ